MKKGLYTSPKKMPEREKELIRIKRSWQMTLPLKIRRHLNVREGDYLEVVITDKGMLLLPIRIITKKIKPQNVR